MSVTKAAIDRLGERLKRSPISERDLRLLDEFRRSFGAAYLTVVGTIRGLGIPTTGRPAGRPLRSSPSCFARACA